MSSGGGALPNHLVDSSSGNGWTRAAGAVTIDDMTQRTYTNSRIQELGSIAGTTRGEHTGEHWDGEVHIVLGRFGFPVGGHIGLGSSGEFDPGVETHH